MTTDETLRRSICADPGDDLRREAYADWLEENAVEASCTAFGPHHGDACNAGRIQSPNAQFTQDCSDCHGTGRVSDGRAARAEFIRTQVELARLEQTRIELFNDETAWDQCTELSARWCPNCGDCRCRDPESSLSDEDCPLHAPQSSHCCLAEVEERTDKLRRRERELLSPNWLAWMPDWPNHPPFACGNQDCFPYSQQGAGSRHVSMTFARGFVSELHLPLAALTDDLARAVWSVEPVTRCYIIDADAAERGSLGFCVSLPNPGLPFIDPKRLIGWRTRDEALDKLAREVANWARGLCGLDALPAEVASGRRCNGE